MVTFNKITIKNTGVLFKILVSKLLSYQRNLLVLLLEFYRMYHAEIHYGLKFVLPIYFIVSPPETWALPATQR